MIGFLGRRARWPEVGPDAGAPRADGSWRNGLAHKSDFWFCTPFFAAELAVKVGSGARARRASSDRRPALSLSRAQLAHTHVTIKS